MTTTRQCPECGTELPANTPEGQCPKCLLKVGLGSHPEATSPPPNTPSPPPAPADLARHFPQLEILEVLGQGGMGVVYKARQPRLDRLVALKILPADPARDPSFAERFTREARALARLSHPNIVAVYDFGETSGIYYLVMELVDGMNLRQLEVARRLQPSEALKIVPSICDALQYAHDLGIVHRDIKPENILLDQQGRVKIADFGLAKLLARATPGLTLTQTRQVMGTVNYMAPEQMEHPLEVDHRADIYSLGVVFYEMLTGELPIGRFAPPSQKVEVDVRLDHVVLRALEKERERRYQHASEVKTDMEHIATQPPSAGPPMAVAGEVAQWLAAKRAVKGPATGLLVVGILNWLLVPLLVMVLMWVVSREGGHTPKGAPLTVALLTVMALSTFLIVAALKMKALEGYWLAVAGASLALLVSPGNLIGLPIGLWALVTLTRPSIKPAFRNKPVQALIDQAAATPGSGHPPGDPARRWFFTTLTVVLIGAGLLGLLVVAALVASVALPALHKAKQKAQTVALAQRTETATALQRTIFTHLNNENIVVRNAGPLTLHDSMDSGRLAISGLLPADSTGTNSGTSFQAEFLLIRINPSTWRIQGTKALSHLNFTVETPAAPPGTSD